MLQPRVRDLVTQVQAAEPLQAAGALQHTVLDAAPAQVQVDHPCKPTHRRRHPEPQALGLDAQHLPQVVQFQPHLGPVHTIIGARSALVAAYVRDGTQQRGRVHMRKDEGEDLRREVAQAHVGRSLLPHHAHLERDVVCMCAP